MNPRVVEAVHRDIERINFLPSKRQALMERFALHPR
jgi:hypothetical protein